VSTLEVTIKIDDTEPFNRQVIEALKAVQNVAAEEEKPRGLTSWTFELRDSKGIRVGHAHWEK